VPRKLHFGHLATTVAFAFLFVAVADAARGRRASIDSRPTNDWVTEQPYTFVASPDGENWGPSVALTPNPAPVNGVEPLRMKIGSKTYTHVWINRNGFIALAENASAPPVLFSPGFTSLGAVEGDIIAPFYAPVHLREPDVIFDEPCSNVPFSCLWDLTFSRLDVRDLIDPENPDPDNDPAYLGGFRVTWGLFPIISSDPPQPNREPGVSTAGAGASPPRNTFQLWVKDRQWPDGQPGDFDLDLNYSGLKWQAPNTHVGVKTGPANSPDVLVDFAKFYTSFLDDSADVSPANIAACASGASENPEGASFDKAFPLGCNRITIEFRDGVPRLKTYTSDLSTTLTAAAGTPHAAVPHGLTLTIANGNHDPATNVTARIELPAAVTLTSTPAATCSQAGSVATCRPGTLQPQASVVVPVQITSSQDGTRNIRVTVDADQYDFSAAANTATASLEIAASADLSVTACTRPTTVAQGSTANVTCTVRNDGPQAATDIVLESTIPGTLSFTSGTGCAAAGAALTCTLASLASGATHDFTVTFGAPAAGNATLNMAVRSLVTFDPQPNVSRDASFLVSAPPPPPPPPPAKKGGRLSYEFIFALLFIVAVAVRQRRFIGLARSASRPAQ
jgi:uncharacterized repeat protein (TIGR01451 family)